ncbi:hypothetical protein PISMIDRAFT_11508 [Pisolithus microcarpus 441]|uniref:Uncharacterized protein n=1 Tax=Pisolithus microcarpus 441 TaxID=765257 RepID=A0A0C9Z0S1_9AGAM|nr:hypothetical protein BKA83DRAFT_11508 [Pisolithus microcarpus]KIK22661.1 hypothetical protein PISMIDRAFT_11508 [Pisolithus microcarpus 441]
MGTSTDSISPLLNRCRERLMASRLYLGDGSLAENLQWVHEGCGHILVYEPKRECEGASAPHEPTVQDEKSTCPSHQSSDPTFAAPPEAAVLSAIVRIDRDHFWLTSDGGYLGPNAICKEILDVKPSCAMGNPGMEPAQSDFPTVLQILWELTQRCVTAGYSAGPSCFTTEKNSPTCFKLRHRLFEAIDSGIDIDNETEDDTASTEDPYSFERWPLTKERNRAQLLALKHSHHLRPVPAYDLNNDLLHPSTYRRCLQGAIVEVHFTMSHWSIASTKRDVYGGLIKLIRILVPAVVSPSAGKKQKLPLHLDIDDTPVKRCVL